ncbi:hypothetical protein [Caudoviricetes sp.]|nr:hypothetical protein [Caudoviricetes sp.]
MKDRTSIFKAAAIALVAFAAGRTWEANQTPPALAPIYVDVTEFQNQLGDFERRIEARLKKFEAKLPRPILEDPRNYLR